MKKEIANFSVNYLQILDENGKCDEKNMPSISVADIKRMYELMVLTRTFDDKAITLQRQGRLGTYASIKGQEACQVGSAIQMEDNDLAFPAFREHALFLTRGTPAEKLFQYWGGDERGMNITANVFPVSITVGGHLPHAVGAAIGFKMQKKKSCTLVYFGDGATSEGDFHEAMNFAGVFKAPTVFICQNNQYAISTPVTEQTAAQTIAQKAIAYGFEGIRVDGNDIFAVYKATQEAIKKARSGNGPTLIECFTYRLGDHTTSDDAKKYRSEKETKEWSKKDPILRLKDYMKKKKILTDSYEKKVLEESTKTISEALEKFENMESQKPEELFQYTFKEMTPELVEQLDQLKKGGIMNLDLKVLDLGKVTYHEAWELQKDLFNKRINGYIPDTLVFAEHSPTISFGKNAEWNKMHVTEEDLKSNGVDLVMSERGGGAAYLGPGILMGYTIMDIKPYGGILNFMKMLEETMIRTASTYNIPISRYDAMNPTTQKPYRATWYKEGEDKKVLCTKGIHVLQKGNGMYTHHGFALNVNRLEPTYFHFIDPCGFPISEVSPIAMSDILGKNVDMSQVKLRVSEQFKDVFNYRSELQGAAA